MSNFDVYEWSEVMYCYPLVGIYRHDSLMCRPGLYGVILCIDLEWGGNGSLPAVCDDFGNLVRVA